ncbi:DUF4012 domain-containing protein [Patescibacteria group bacterium]|nr:DUF4012 domain-containing protein [Patescibacteria group bacterium]MCG2688002.1 DUF4012 domain-containing protein [Candidatus Parcubacteria bacterium]
MPVKKQKSKKGLIKKPKMAPVAPALFDDALPVSLKNKGISDVLDLGVRIHKSSQGKLSPYIIKLDHEKQAVQSLEVSQKDKIKELADSLAKSSIGDYQLIEETETEDITILSLDDLAIQLRETERTISPGKVEAKLEQDYEIFAGSQINVEIPNVFEILDQEKQLPIAIEPAEKIEEDSITITQTITGRFHNLHLLLPKQARHRAIAVFLLLSFVLVMPIHAMQGLSDTSSRKTEIERVSQQAISQIDSATDSIKSQDFQAASLDFQRATENFQNAQKSMDDMRLITASLVNIIPQTNSTYETVQGLVSAGASLSQSGAKLSSAIEELSNSNSLSLVTKLQLLTTYITNALPEVQTANNALKNINLEFIPQDYTNKLTLLLSTVPSLQRSMEEFLKFSGTLQTLLGNQEKMRYLLVFQNNTELRATGGFIGSFAQIDVLDGEITNIDIPGGGSYDVQGQLSEFVAPPQPLSLLNDRWEFHDANWFPDFPSSAQKLIWFYQKAGGPTVDGVIAINATLMPQLLEITGPIAMPEYGRTITSENFLFETQKIVEYEYASYQDDGDREQDAPKQFIGDLAPKVLEILKQADPETLLKVIDLLSASLTQKDVLMYMEDNQLQSDIETLNWSGSLKNTQGDYLMVVDSNLGGGKTDTVIKQGVNLDVEIQEDGSIINTVTITKEHTGMSSALFEGVNNVDYVRLYVPEGSEFIQANGFEIPDESLFEQADTPLSSDTDMLLWTANFAKDPISQTDIWDEQGKTVFGNWIQTKPGETEVATFTYKLPWKFEQTNDSIFQKAKSYIGLKNLNEYSIFIQKQPGVVTRTTTIRVFNATNQKVIWTSQNDLFSSGTEFNNDQDRVLSALFEQF